MMASQSLAPAKDQGRGDAAACEPVPAFLAVSTTGLMTALTVSGQVSATTSDGSAHQEATPGCTSNAERPMTFKTKHRLDRAVHGAKCP